jgi:4-nitrophenyl phosphatase
MNLELLTEIRCFLLDQDGTFYLGDRLLPGALEFIRVIRERDLEFLFLTNNSSRHRRQYAEKIRSFGLDISDEKVFTSGEATAQFLSKQYPGATVHIVGTPALEETIESFGFRLTNENPDLVVLGFDTTLTYEKLWRLCNFVREGIPYIATHHDLNCPTEGGYMPDIGAMIAFVEASTDCRPDIIVGKPHRPMMEALELKTGLPVEVMCMVGDRLYTDIALGKQGATTVLVLSGETKLNDLQGSEFQPDYVVQDLAELSILLQNTPSVLKSD